MRPFSLSRWVVAVAFMAVVLAFLLSSAAFVQATGSIDRDARVITQGSSPAIEVLAAARVSLVRLHDLLSDEVDRCARGQPVSIKAAQEAERDLRIQTAAYRKIRPFEDEVPLARTIDHELTQLYVDVAQSNRMLQALDCDQARKQVEGPLAVSMAEASMGFMRDIQLNARHASQSAETIGRTQREAERLAVVLNVAAVVVAMGAAGAVVFGLGRRERLQAEHLRLQEERSRELELFAARVAHDIRSPLSAVVLALDIAQRTTDQAKWLAKSRNGLRRVEQIVDALYQFALAGGSPRPGTTERPGEVLDDVLEALQGPAAEANLELRVTSASTDPVACPPGVLATLVTNLVHNAIKYGSGDGGVVAVSMMRTASRVRVSVADPGPGVSNEVAAKIFQPYVRVDPTSGSGLGLGLATVRRLSQAYGGTCGVESVPGKGATFWFELPVDTTPAQVEETATHAPTEHLH